MPASPRAARLATPGWLDARLLLGVVLVLASVVAGARLLGSADDAQPVWVATRDLAAGTTLAEGDLEPGRVRLFGDGSRYVLAAGAAPLGYVLARPVGARELLPAAGLVTPQAAVPELRDVALPVEAGHLPDDLQGGQQVDVYVTAGQRGGASAASATRASGAAAQRDAEDGTPGVDGATRLVLSGATVQQRARDSGVGARVQAVVLSVPAADVPRLVSAVQSGLVDLVRLPRAVERPVLPVPPAR